MNTTLVALLAAAAGMAAAAPCDSLKSLDLPHTEITLAAQVAANAFQPPPDAGTPAAFAGLPSFCRVHGVLKPSSDSEIHFEVWMPETWNGRYQGIGNGGFAGSISYAQMAGAVRTGYVASSTDTGHQAGGVDGRWANGHPEKIIDYGHRAVHETAVTAKAVAQAYYGKPVQKSYFSSCSNGGRQALMEAQRYPTDYDGIIAGAPAYRFTRLLASFIWDLQALAADGGFIPMNKLSAIESAALKACDAGDGVSDGVIDAPLKCDLDPSSIVCPGPDSESCLTAAQAAALKKIISGARNSRGERLNPGFPVGAMTGVGGWGRWIFGETLGNSAQAQFGTQLQMQFLMKGDQWDFRTFHFDKDVVASDDKLGPILNATNPDLQAFRRRGGKLILWHGWADPAIPAENSIQYFENVTKKMGRKEVDEFVRLFLAPGMQHCGGGPGPNQVGAMAGSPGDASSNVMKAMEQWVEQGVAPNRIIAAKRKNDADPASELDRTRPLCAYPQVARYKGSGSTDDAANFDCAAAK